jgi:hypothetical protein
MDLQRNMSRSDSCIDAVQCAINEFRRILLLACVRAFPKVCSFRGVVRQSRWPTHRHARLLPTSRECHKTGVAPHDESRALASSRLSKTESRPSKTEVRGRRSPPRGVNPIKRRSVAIRSAGPAVLVPQLPSRLQR